jgi:hypothetical protein
VIWKHTSEVLTILLAADAQELLHPLECLVQIARKTNLDRLSLASTGVTDLTPLARLTGLQLLCLASTAVSADQVSSLQASLPKLVIYRKS